MRAYIDRHAVMPFRTRLKRKRKPRQIADNRFEWTLDVVHDLRFPVKLADRRILQKTISKAGSMREQVANGHRADEIDLTSIAAGCRGEDFNFAKCRDEFRDRVEQLKSAFFVKSHQRHTHDRFRH